MNKSIFDGVEVCDTAFPLRPRKAPKETLSITGHCPQCGAPIYGPKEVTVGELVQIQHSCTCHTPAIMMRTT